MIFNPHYFLMPKTSDTLLAFVSANPFSISTYTTTKSWDGTIYYSTDTASWQEWNGRTTIDAVFDGTNYNIFMKGRNNTYISAYTAVSFSDYRWVITGSDVHCIGNIENLLDWLAVRNGNHPSMAKGCFSGLFWGCSALVQAPSLPATTLNEYCYAGMFRGTSITEAPNLPATTAYARCYQSMFADCASLVTVQSSLPATTLYAHCYQSMFNGCSSLVTPPELPSTSLNEYCYEAMFQDCVSLTSMPSLNAYTLYQECYCQMFQGCISLTTAKQLPAGTLASGCYYHMFQGCVNLATVPLIHGSDGNWPSYACAYMFYGCSKIKMSSTKTGDYSNTYYINAGSTSSARQQMFGNTGGSFTGTPNSQGYLYTSNTVV